MKDDGLYLDLVCTIAEMKLRLEGAAGLCVYLLHRLGGQVTIPLDEYDRVTKDFDTVALSASKEATYAKLLSRQPKGDLK